MLLCLNIVAVVYVGFYMGMLKPLDPLVSIVLESILNSFGMLMDHF